MAWVQSVCSAVLSRKASASSTPSALVPREGEVVAGPGEVVLHVALRAGERAELLDGGPVHVAPLPLERLDERGLRDPEVHRLRVVAVRARDGVDHLVAERGPRLRVERLRAHLGEEARGVRALTRPAGRRLRAGIVPDRRPRPEGLLDVVDRVDVAARGVVVLREPVPREEDGHVGGPLQQVDPCRAVVLAAEGGVRHRVVRRQLAGERLPPHVRARLVAGRCRRAGRTRTAPPSGAPRWCT
jgi:hypothetical protein